MTPLICGRTSAVSNAATRPGSSFTSGTDSVFTVTTPTAGGGGAGGWLSPHPLNAKADAHASSPVKIPFCIAWIRFVINLELE